MNNIWACEKCGRSTLLKDKRVGKYKCIICGSVQQNARFNVEEKHEKSLELDSNNGEEYSIKSHERKRRMVIPENYSKIGSRPITEKKREIPFEITWHKDLLQEAIDCIKEQGALNDEIKAKLTEKDNPYYCPYDDHILTRTDVTIKKISDKNVIVRMFLCPKCKRKYTGIKEYKDFVNIRINGLIHTNLRSNRIVTQMQIGPIQSLMKNGAPSRKSSQKKKVHETDGMNIVMDWR